MSMNEARWKLRDSVDFNYLNWFELSKNPHPAAFEILMKNKNLVDWRRFCINPSQEAIEYLKENPDMIYFEYLCINSNPAIIDLLKGNESKINWSALSSNSGAIELLKANQDKINWANLSSNSSIFEFKNGHMELLEWIPIEKIKSRLLSTNENGLEFLLKNSEIIDYYHLSSNPSAVSFLKENPHKIVWEGLAFNSNPEAIEIFKEYYRKLMDKPEVDYKCLNNLTTYLLKNKNPVAFDFFLECSSEEFFDDFEWDHFISHNPAIFELDYNQMKNNEKFKEFEEELIKEVMKPSRVIKYLESGYDIIEELFDY